MHGKFQKMNALTINLAYEQKKTFDFLLISKLKYYQRNVLKIKS